MPEANISNLYPTNYPLTLVRFALRRPFCPVHLYLQKEFPFLIGPYFHSLPSTADVKPLLSSKISKTKVFNTRFKKSKTKFSDFFDERKNCNQRKISFGAKEIRKGKTPKKEYVPSIQLFYGVISKPLNCSLLGGSAGTINYQL